MSLDDIHHLKALAPSYTSERPTFSSLVNHQILLSFSCRTPPIAAIYEVHGPPRLLLGVLKGLRRRFHVRLLLELLRFRLLSGDIRSAKKLLVVLLSMNTLHSYSIDLSLEVARHMIRPSEALDLELATNALSRERRYTGMRYEYLEVISHMLTREGPRSKNFSDASSFLGELTLGRRELLSYSEEFFGLASTIHFVTDGFQGDGENSDLETAFGLANRGLSMPRCFPESHLFHFTSAAALHREGPLLNSILDDQISKNRKGLVPRLLRLQSGDLYIALRVEHLSTVAESNSTDSMAIRELSTAVSVWAREGISDNVVRKSRKQRRGRRQKRRAPTPLSSTELEIADSVLATLLDLSVDPSVQEMPFCFADVWNGIDQLTRALVIYGEQGEDIVVSCLGNSLPWLVKFSIGMGPETKESIDAQKSVLHALKWLGLKY